MAHAIAPVMTLRLCDLDLLNDHGLYNGIDLGFQA